MYLAAMLFYNEVRLGYRLGGRAPAARGPSAAARPGGQR